MVRLADGQRQAVLVFYLEGLARRGVAAGLPVGAVKAGVHHTRMTLSRWTPSVRDASGLGAGAWPGVWPCIA
jgi:DNA-directed RNA polymerase specialized sigma24 family protein